MATRKDLQRELRELKADAKARGLRSISPFNAGLSRAEVNYNTRRFALETQIQKMPK